MCFKLDYKRRTVVTTVNGYDNMARYTSLKIIKTFVVRD
ncbi:hypothetical protein FHW89_005760 [Mucilaginibacter sp. SG564]|nr:hypothetical protein [Mucilaginibacter sp. SG564]